MSAPQQFADLGGMPLFYVPPDGEPPNAAAAFLTTMVGQRVKNAEEMLARRLASLDPTARNEQLAALAKTRADLVAQLASNERSRDDNDTKRAVAKGSNFDELTKYFAAQAQVQGGLAEADKRIEAARYENRALNQAGQNIVRDAQGVMSSTAAELRAAAALGDPAAREAAVNQAMSGFVRRMNAASQATDALPNTGEQDAVAERVQELSRQLDIGDPDIMERMGRVVSSTFQRPGSIAGSPRGVRFEDPADIARKTLAVDELLGTSTGSSSSATSTSTQSGRSGVPRADVAQTAGTLSSGRVAPSGAGADSASDAEVRRQLSALDDLEARIRAYDPRETLGGLYDPYPGARPERPRVTPEMVSRVREAKPSAFARATGQPKPGKSPDAELEAKALELDPDLFGPVRRAATPPGVRLDNKRVGLEGPEEPPAKPPAKKTGGARAKERLEQVSGTPVKPGAGHGDVRLAESRPPEEEPLTRDEFLRRQLEELDKQLKDDEDEPGGERAR